MSNRLYKSIPAPKLSRNTFDRSRPNSLTMPFQRCVPSMIEEIIPGDLYRVGTETFARLQPLIAPVMNNMKISQHFFFVPLRTLNKHFSEFMFNNRTGDYTEVLPYVRLGSLFDLVDDLFDAGQGSIDFDIIVDVIRLYDYIGLPFRMSSATSAEDFINNFLQDEWNQNLPSNLRVNLAPFLAYQKIWSEYFRDENVEEDPFISFEDELDTDLLEMQGDMTTHLQQNEADYAKYVLRLRPRAWAHDRFTSALPFAQRGPDVLLPIAGQADVTYKQGFLLGDVTPPKSGKVVLREDGSPTVERSYDFVKNNTSSQLLAQSAPSGASSPYKSAYDPNGSLEVDFANAELATTINDFRRAERLQRWYENSARGGVRPNEATLAHFGVKTPDATLDRAEFLGGSMQPIVVSEVAQTSESTVASPQGTLAGKGTSYKGTNAFKAYFTEHGFVFCFTSALVRANYWQGIPKLFSRMQRDEYYWPEFANLGEEPVFTKELYAGSQVTEDQTFGYVPRYSDYKSAVGEVHSDMRSSLAFWTQAREFSSRPVLNREFLFGPAPLTPFAVQSAYTDPIIATIQFSVKASRLMPFYGVPTI